MRKAGPLRLRIWSSFEVRPRVFRRRRITASLDSVIGSIYKVSIAAENSATEEDCKRFPPVAGGSGGIKCGRRFPRKPRPSSGYVQCVPAKRV
ncbi:hypothetical protein KCP73_16965 [Salmonella enterica subsp. enterica]|nr:hypothetical protein KCP73_16965 [Salmonella enterica subsp. enterica]